MKTFQLNIACVGKVLFDGEAREVVLPGADGVFTVLADHEALVSTLVAGTAHVESATGDIHDFPLEKGGVAEVSSGQVTILL